MLPLDVDGGGGGGADTVLTETLSNVAVFKGVVSRLVTISSRLAVGLPTLRDDRAHETLQIC
jgi:hypothetical protein